MLWYTPDLTGPGQTNTTVQIREGVFYRTGRDGQEVPATREDIMMVLYNIELFLIGCVSDRPPGQAFCYSRAVCRNC